jgi:hypothetical protein
MHLISNDSHHATVSLTWPESALVGNTLNEFINGLRIDDDELESRLGCGRPALRPIQQHLALSHRSVWPDNEGDHSDSVSEVRVQLTRAQLATMIRALKDLATGKDIEAWEFPIRLGQQPKAALTLATELDDVVGSLPAQ